MTINPVSKDVFIEQLHKAENSGSFSRKAVSAFYDWMYGNEDGYVQTCAFLMPTSDGEEDIPTKQNAFNHTDSKEEFIDFCNEYSGLWRYQVYSGVNTMPDKPEYGRGKIEHIDTVNTLTLDIETEREPHTGAPKEQVWWSYKYALAQAKFINDQFGVWPMVVMSENGIHLHYKTDLPVEDELLHNKQHRYTKYITKMAMDNKYVEAIEDNAPDSVTFSPDDVSDVPRVMKVPGTLGIKSENGRLCGIIHKPSKQEAGCITTRDIDGDNVPEFEESSSNNSSSGTDYNVALKSDAGQLSDSVKRALKKRGADDELLRSFWQGKTLTYESRSHAEFAFIKKLLGYGFDQNEIQDILEASGMSKWSEEDNHYRRHTLQNAIEQFDGSVKADSETSSLSFRRLGAPSKE